ncbi:hypothetical protein V8F20_000155 [Naviculisporaceae sp. PSN 640]
MRSLMPLKLPSSQHRLQALSRTDFGGSQKMDVDDSDVSFDLAEALAKDLDESKSAFAAKSMTSGSPAQGLANSHVDEDDDTDSFEGPSIPRYPSIRSQRPAMGYQRISRQITDEQDVLAASGAERDANIRYEAGHCSDSVSDSSAAIEPALIRTRQQSVVTAATSISGGRNSAFPSPKFPTTSEASLSNYSLQPREGTWFDEDDDFAPSSQGQIDYQPREPFYFHNRSAVSLSGADFGEMAAPDMRTAIGPSTSTNFHFPLRNPAEIQRPQTASGLPIIERPRLVNIQPSVAVPRRRSSLKRPHGLLPSASPSRYQREYLQEMDESYASYEMHPEDNPRLLSPSTSVAMLTTSCGRMIIDASRPSSFDSTGEPAQRRIITAPQSRLSIIDNTDFEEGEQPADYTYPERPTRLRDQSRENVHHWLDSGMGNRSASVPDVIPHSPSTPGIPLPPDVVETLRISLSCFPETMLLTSSLSIETIRAYSRKLRHKVGGGGLIQSSQHQARQPGDDNKSVFSFSSQNTKRPKRWNFNRLVSGQKQNKHSHQIPHSQTENKLPRSSFTSGSDPSSPISPDSHHQAMVPDWAPIKRIFPAGSDYLCDALYAHVVVYNYLDTMCPLPVANPVPQIKQPTRQSQPFDVLGHAQNRKIPKKAASILGMQGPPGSTPGSSQYETTTGLLDGPNQSGNKPTSGRRFQFPFQKPQDANMDDISVLLGGKPHGKLPLSASVGHGSGGIETAVIRDLQAGLTRCIGLLVTTLEKGFTTGSDETAFLVEEQHQIEMSRRDGEGSAGRSGNVSPFLLRSLCEVVRASEGAEEGHGAI